MPAAVAAPLPLERPSTRPYDVEAVRRDFPILGRRVRENRLVYLDNAATTQKPQAVITAVSEFYSGRNANVHRGVHQLSQEATADYEKARERVARFINSPTPAQVIFTRGTTEGINLVAQSYARSTLRPGDEIVVSELEHHSNIVPWQLVAEQTGAVIRALPVHADGSLAMEQLDVVLSDRTRIVALTLLSNALGTITPARAVVDAARARGAVVVLDAAQAASHLGVDVVALDCDFLALSGHKLYGPTGIGVLYGRESLLEQMPPWQGGGDMIRTVTIERSSWADPPAKFEAGTPTIAAAVGLAVAIDYVEALGPAQIAAWERILLDAATRRLEAIPGVTVVGTAEPKASILSFVMDAVHPHDIGTVLDARGVAVRAGHHCAQPLMARLGVGATARASFACYNTLDEVDAFAEAVRHVREVFGR